MADKRIYVANAVPVAQVDEITMDRNIYLTQQIGEGSGIQATINNKTIIARLDPKVEQVDGNSVLALLTEFVNVWNSTSIPEFREVTASLMRDDDAELYYVHLTANVLGRPFDVEIAALYPVVDVDTIEEGMAGRNASYQFTISPVATGGTFRIQWDVGNGVEVSNSINYPPTAESIKNAMISGMSSFNDTNFDVVQGSNVRTYTLSLKGSLGETATSVPYVNTANVTGGGVVSSSTANDGGTEDASVDDTFNDVESTPLTDHVGSTGHGWSAGNTDFGAASYLGAISGNKWSLYESIQDIGTSNAFAINSFNEKSDGVVSIEAQNSVAAYFENYSITTVNEDDKVGGVYSVMDSMRFSIGILGRYVDKNDYVMARCVWIAPVLVSGSYVNGGYFLQILKRVAGTTVVVNSEKFTMPGNTFGSWSGSKYNPASFNVRLEADFSGDIVTFTLYDIGRGTSYNITGDLDGYDNGSKKFGVYVGSGSLLTTSSASAWGVNFDNFKITDDAAITNEVQNIWHNGQGGTFTLTYGSSTTAAIPVSVDNAALETYLETIVGAGKIQVNGGNGTSEIPWQVEFIGDLAGTDVSQISGNGANLTGSATSAVTTIVEGLAGRAEQWAVTLIEVTGGTFSIEIKGRRTAEIAYNANAATVRSAIGDIDIIGGSSNVSVTGSGTTGDPYLIRILHPDFANVNAKQIVVHNDKLVGAGGPPFTHVTIIQSEGPWHWDCPLNWWNPVTREYGLPQEGDDLYFELGDALRCPLYDLDQSTLEVNSIIFLGGFTDNAMVGLPRWNSNGYWEYRETELKIKLSGDANIVIGARGGGGSPLLNINTLNTKTNIRVVGTASPLQGEHGCLQWRGTHAENVIEVFGGFVSVAACAGQTAKISNLIQRDGSILTGSGVSIDRIDSTGGQLRIDFGSINGTVNLMSN